MATAAARPSGTEPVEISEPEEEASNIQVAFQAAQQAAAVSETYDEAYDEYKRLYRMNAGSGLMDRVIGAGFAFVIGVIMLNFLFGIDLVANSTGPFSDQLTTIEEVIGAAIVLGALGILALAGYYARSMMGGM